MCSRRKWWLLALLVSACALNPHPDIPSASDSPGPGVAGSSTSGGNATAGSGGSGSPVLVDPGTGTGGRGPDLGEGGDRGDSAGDSGLPEGGAAEGGAAEAGAAGADQLAPGPTR